MKKCRICKEEKSIEEFGVRCKNKDGHASHCKVCVRKKRQKKSKFNKDGTLTYLMYDEKYYKIGKSKNPKKRLSQLKTGNPSCELVCSGNMAEEKFLHEKYKRQRIGGEWFDLGEESVKKIMGLIISGNDDTKGVLSPYEKKMEDIHFKSDLKYEVSKIKPNKQKLQEFKVEKYDEKTLIELSKKYKKFIVGYGKYKGKALYDLRSKEDLEYFEWMIDRISVNRNEIISYTEKAYKWWIEVNKYWPKKVN